MGVLSRSLFTHLITRLILIQVRLIRTQLGNGARCAPYGILLKDQLDGEVAFGVVVADEAPDGGHPE